MEAAGESHAEQLATGADRPSRVAVTSVDEAGRPRIRHVSEANLFDTAAAAVSTVESSLLSGEVVLAVETDRPVSADADAPANGAASDPLRRSQWALDQFPFEAATRATSGGQKVVISVVDTGDRPEPPRPDGRGRRLAELHQ